MGFKKTIAGRLLKIVFGLYFIIAFLLTLVQLRGEYFHTRTSIQEEIISLQKSFEPILAEALWRYDYDALKSTLFGMQKLSSIVGIRILDSENQNVYTVGYVNASSDSEMSEMTYFNQEGEPAIAPKEQKSYERLFDFSFSIRYHVDNQSHVVGKGQLYSSNRIVVSRLKYSFLMIIINSLIKTISLWMIFIFFIRKIVSSPLKKLTEEAEQLNPENKAFSFEHMTFENSDLLARSDEVGILAQKFEAMRKALAQRDSKISDYQNNLEKKVSLRTGQLESAVRNIQTIMDNIEEGIFTISSKNLVIDPGYSGHLESVFGRSDLSQVSISDLLLKNSETGSDRIQIVEDCLKMMLTEDIVNFRLNEHLLPREIRIKNTAKITVFLVDWVAICSVHGLVEKVMVTVKDVTEWVQLKKNFEKNFEEVQVIEQILRVPDYDLSQFFSTNDSFFGDIENYSSTKNLMPEQIVVWMRSIHSSKGISRNLNFCQLSDAFHELEERLEAIKKRARYIGEQSSLILASSKCREINARYCVVHQKLIRYLMNHRKIETQGEGVSTSSEIFSILMSGISEISAAKGIEDPFIELIDLPFFEGTRQEILLKILIHLVSNAVMHGIEEKKDRIRKEKPPRGLITISGKPNGTEWVISVKDDGKGVCLSGLKNKYKDIWAKHQNPESFLNTVLFLDGYSGSDQVTIHSGRGVGLSAARELVRSVNGELLLGTAVCDPKGGQSEYVKIEFRLTISDAEGKAVHSLVS